MQHGRRFTVFDPIPAPPYRLPEEAPSHEVIFGLLQRHTKAELLSAIEEVCPRKTSHGGGKAGRPKIDNEALIGPLLTLAALVWYSGSPHTRNLSWVSARLAKLSLNYVLTSWEPDQKCYISTEGELHNAEGIRRKLTGYMKKRDSLDFWDFRNILVATPFTLIMSISSFLGVEPLSMPKEDMELWRFDRWQMEEMRKKLKSCSYPFQVGEHSWNLPTPNVGLLEFKLSLSKSSNREMLSRGLREFFRDSVGKEWDHVIASWKP